MEIFDLYTADRVKTGKTMVRGEPVPEGFYRLVVHVCIFDSRGRMLIQQRQPFKKGWSNLWDISVGGCAVAGDSSRTAAERETFEELGLAIDLSDVRPTMTIHWEHGFDDYYVLTLDVDPESLHLQYEEVQSVEWASEEEILQMIDDGRFIPYEKSQIQLISMTHSARIRRPFGVLNRKCVTVSPFIAIPPPEQVSKPSSSAPRPCSSAEAGRFSSSVWTSARQADSSRPIRFEASGPPSSR